MQINLKYNSIENFKNDFLKRWESKIPLDISKKIEYADTEISVKVKTSGNTKISYVKKDGIYISHTMFHTYDLLNFYDDNGEIICDIDIEKKIFPTGFYASDNMIYKGSGNSFDEFINEFIYETVIPEAENMIESKKLEERFYKKDRTIEISLIIKIHEEKKECSKDNLSNKLNETVSENFGNSINETIELELMDEERKDGPYIYNAKSEEDVEKLIKSKRFEYLTGDGYHCIITRYIKDNYDFPGILNTELIPNNGKFRVNIDKYIFDSNNFALLKDPPTVYFDLPKEQIQEYSLSELEKTYDRGRVEVYTVFLAKQGDINEIIHHIEETVQYWMDVTGIENLIDVLEGNTSHREMVEKILKECGIPPELVIDPKPNNVENNTEKILEKYSIQYISDWYNEAENYYNKHCAKIDIDYKNIEALVSFFVELLAIKKCKRIEFLYSIPNPEKESTSITLIDFRIEAVMLATRWMIYGEARNNFGKLIDNEYFKSFIVDTMPNGRVNDEWVDALENLLNNAFTSFKSFAEKCSNNVSLQVKYAEGI